MIPGEERTQEEATCSGSSYHQGGFPFPLIFQPMTLNTNKQARPVTQVASEQGREHSERPGTHHSPGERGSRGSPECLPDSQGGGRAGFTVTVEKRRGDRLFWCVLRFASTPAALFTREI